MIKNISNLGDAALYCDFGTEVNKEINRNVINYFNNLRDSNFLGITNITPSYNKLVISFDLKLTSFAKLKKQVENLELKKINNSKNNLIKIPVCCTDEFGVNYTIASLSIPTVSSFIKSIFFHGHTYSILNETECTYHE